VSQTTEAETSDHRVTGAPGSWYGPMDSSAPDHAWLTDLASDEGLGPDYLIVPEGGRPLVAQAEASADLQRVHAGEGFRVYRVKRSG
jgi:hypothetical protein